MLCPHVWTCVAHAPQFVSTQKLPLFSTLTCFTVPTICRSRAISKMSEQYGYDVSEQAQNVKYKYAASPGGQNGTTFVLMWSWVNLPTLPATSSSRVHANSFSGLSPYQFERSSSDKQIPNSLIMQFTSTDYWCSSGIENARVARILRRPKLSKDDIFLKILWCHSHHLNNIIKLKR